MSGTINSLEQVEPSELQEQLGFCHLSLYGGENDCVWVTIAYLLGKTVDEIKRLSGLSPTAGIAGIDENAVRVLLTALGQTFWAHSVNGLASKTKHSSPIGAGDTTNELGFFEGEMSRTFAECGQSLGVCYLRTAMAGQVATGHCVVYQPTHSAQAATSEPNIGLRRFRPVREEQLHPPFRFVNYTTEPASDALWDVKESEIKFVFGFQRTKVHVMSSEKPGITMSRQKHRRQLDDAARQIRDERLRVRRGIADADGDIELPFAP